MLRDFLSFLPSRSLNVHHAAGLGGDGATDSVILGSVLLALVVLNHALALLLSFKLVVEHGDTVLVHVRAPVLVDGTL